MPVHPDGQKAHAVSWRWGCRARSLAAFKLVAVSWCLWEWGSRHNCAKRPYLLRPVLGLGAPACLASEPYFIQFMRFSSPRVRPEACQMGWEQERLVAGSANRPSHCLRSQRRRVSQSKEQQDPEHP